MIPVQCYADQFYVKKLCYFYDLHKEYVDMENQKKNNLKLINLS